jgi:hypothetical protein
MPSVLHFCQFYRAGEFGFQKRRIKKEMFNCDHPLMAELPRDIGKIDYKNRDGEVSAWFWRQLCCVTRIQLHLDTLSNNKNCARRSFCSS